MSHTARILSIEARSVTGQSPVQIIQLDLPPDFRFEAGQYLEVVHPDGERIPLSIASVPEALPRLELHYRSTPGLPQAALLDQLLINTAAELLISEPAGAVRLAPEDGRRLLLVAAGTGISQALSLARAQAERHPTVSVTLLACAEREQDFYYLDMLPQSEGFEAITLADARRTTRNRGLAWLRDHMRDFQSPDIRIILSGSPAFVYAATDTLSDAGCSPERLESDVYAYAPR